MKVFRYKVRDQNGNPSEGSMEANDEKQVVTILRGKGMLVTSIFEENQFGVNTLFGKYAKPKSDEITNFTRQLSTMVGAGLPLVSALRILKAQSSKSMNTVIEKVLTEVEAGSTLADALEVSGGGFTTVYLAMVRAGESAGVLDQVLRKLADNLDKDREFRGKTKGAMVYPVIILIGIVVIVAIMMIVVVPKLTAMYKDFGAELPTPTKILMGISGFFVNYWFIIAFVLIGGFIFFSRWAKTEVGSLIVEQLTFRIPIWGKLRKDLILTEFARTVSVLLAAGIPILDTLQIVSETLGSKVYGAQVRQSATMVEKGISLAEAMQQLAIFPPILAQMVSVGEETGKLDEVLAKLATFYEGESEVKVKALTTAIEPMIMVIMGVGVGFLVIAVIMPIYNLTSQF
jgi:type IV pilus assembly protein PilC